MTDADTVFSVCYRYPNGNEHTALSYRTHAGAEDAIRRARRKIAFSSCDHWIEEIEEKEAGHVVEE